MPIVTKQIREGYFYQYRLLAIGERLETGRLHCPVLEFFKLAQREHPVAMERLTALLDRTAEQGPPANETKFKRLADTDGIFEFKAKPLRDLCFRDENQLIICTNAVIEKAQKASSECIETAENWKRAYFGAKLKKELIHEPEQ